MRPARARFCERFLCTRQLTRGRLPSDANVDLPFDVGPFRGCAQSVHEFLEARRVVRGELEPCEEVERLSEIASMVQPSRDPREVLQAGGDMAGAVLEDATTLVLREVPPRLGFLDRNQRRTGRSR